MKRALSIILVLGLAVGATVAYRALRPKAETYTITADVVQAPNLFEGGRVMVRGVEVGVITDVVPDIDAVHITLEIEEGIKVPEGASLAIVPITVIADRYVQLYPPYETGPVMEDGDNIPVTRTQIPAELDDVLTQLQGLLSALEPKPGEENGPLARLITNLDDALDGKSKSLAVALNKSAGVLQNLADSDQDITGLIRNLNDVFIALANRSSEIGLVNERLMLVTEALAGDQEDLEGTIEGLAFFSDQASLLIDESGDSLGKAFGNLAAVLHKVNAQQDELLAGVQWNNVVSQGLGAVDASGKGLFAYTGKQAEPGSPGSEYNYRIDTRDTIACNRLGDLVEQLFRITALTKTELVRSVLTHFAPSYRSDITFIIEEILPVCADLSPAAPEQSAVPFEHQAATAEVLEEAVVKGLETFYLQGGGK